MAQQTTTTRQAAVWKPPRLSKLYLGSTWSGTKGNPVTTTWETNCPVAAAGYRMPTSGEMGVNPPICP